MAMGALHADARFHDRCPVRKGARAEDPSAVGAGECHCEAARNCQSSGVMCHADSGQVTTVSERGSVFCQLGLIVSWGYYECNKRYEILLHLASHREW